jgi:hypothetical protein
VRVQIVCAATVVIALVVAGLPAVNSQPGDASKYLGVWLHDDRDREIEIAPCAGEAGAVCAKIVRVMDPKTGQTRDGSPLVDAVVLQSCTPKGSDLECARAYVPSKGKSYSDVAVTLKRDGRLNIGGLFGTNWIRVK